MNAAQKELRRRLSAEIERHGGVHALNAVIGARTGRAPSEYQMRRWAARGVVTRSWVLPVAAATGIPVIAFLSDTPPINVGSVPDEDLLWRMVRGRGVTWEE